MNDELKTIKKQYGEKFSRLCRTLFPTILETKGLLLNLLNQNFEPNHFLADDLISCSLIDEFRNYIYSLANLRNKSEALTTKTPEELLATVGYDFYECHTQEDIMQFRKYYAVGEKLCTFREERLNFAHVFFAVKKDVAKIKREDFPNPLRQDLYGTSVLSIQFLKDGTNTLSIKNRYNQAVLNPDATFSNNLDNIVPGLTESFKRHYNLVQQYEYNSMDIDSYVVANDSKHYKYNYELNGIYYCPNNIIIDNGEVKRFEREKYIILDYFILDLTNKKLILYDNTIQDSFIDTIKDITKITVTNILDRKEIVIQTADYQTILITVNEKNQIIEYKNSNVLEVGDNFLYKNKTLKTLELESLAKAGHNFLQENAEMTKVSLQQLQQVGEDFLYRNRVLENLDLPNLKFTGRNFLYYNQALTKVNLPSLIETKDNFCFTNQIIAEIKADNLKKVGNAFLINNLALTVLNLPSLELCGSDFLSMNENISKVFFPNLTNAARSFLMRNLELTKLDLPSIVSLGYMALYSNNKIQSFNAPNLEKIDFSLLNQNKVLEYFNAPKLSDDDYKNLSHLAVVNKDIGGIKK